MVKNWCYVLSMEGVTVTQRQLHDIERQIPMYNKISDAYTDQQKLFFQLFNKERSTKTMNTDYITVKNIEYLSTEKIIEGWQFYFETPSETKADSEYGIQIHEDITTVIEDI